MSASQSALRDNPAARLHRFFADFEDVARKRSGVAVPPISTALADMWDLSWPEQSTSIMRLAADVVELPDLVRQAVQGAPENPFLVKSEILSPYEYWSTATHSLANLSNSSSEVTNRVSSASQEKLLYCARLLGQHSTLPPLPVDDMASLTGMVNDLVESVLTADISSELRAFLLNQLEAMREALIRARAEGAEALLDGHALVSSRMYRRRNRGDAAAAEAPSLWHRFRLFVHEFGIVAALASDLSGAPANVITLTDALNGDKPSVVLQITPAHEEHVVPELSDGERPAIEGPSLEDPDGAADGQEPGA